MAAPTQEGACDHLATKADVERVRVEVERLRADVSRLALLAMISAMGVIAGVVLAIIKFT